MEGTKVSSGIWGHSNHTFHVQRQHGHRAACVATEQAELAFLMSNLRYLSQIGVQTRPKKRIFATQPVSRQKCLFVPSKHEEEERAHNLFHTFFSSLTWLKESLFRVSSWYLQKVITSHGCQTQTCADQCLSLIHI